MIIYTLAHHTKAPFRYYAILTNKNHTAIFVRVGAALKWLFWPLELWRTQRYHHQRIFHRVASTHRHERRHQPFACDPSDPAKRLPKTSFTKTRLEFDPPPPDPPLDPPLVPAPLESPPLDPPPDDDPPSRSSRTKI